MWSNFPAKTDRLPNGVLMMGYRLRRWPNIKTPLVKRSVFAGLRPILGCHTARYLSNATIITSSRVACLCKF